MHPCVESPYRVAFDGSFRVDAAPTAPPEDRPSKKALKSQLLDERGRIAELQRMLYAEHRHSLLLVFQAIDAAGKDSTIRNVLEGVNPAGCRVVSFKKPSYDELSHDFLWRTTKELPRRGRIGVFNRSYYEEVLVVRVHPELLEYQQLPTLPTLPEVWAERFRAIREHERHLAHAGTVVVKFWLNVSKDEQKRRFLSRLDEPHKHWKFEAGDVRERQFFDQYLEAYQDLLNATSRPLAPWYAIPADDKPFMRWQVARIVRETLEGLDLGWPTVDPDEAARFDELRAQLEAE